MKNREKILNFLQWNDKNGTYTDENCRLEGISIKSFREAIKEFFWVINEDFYYKNYCDNIFELNLNQVISYTIEGGLFKNSIEKLKKLMNMDVNKENQIELYKELLK